MELDKMRSKINTFEGIATKVKQWKSNNLTVVFTNGCFDILHFGHLHYLAAARDLGDRLVVGLNSAASVSRLKGAHRPLNDEWTRQYILAALAFVDAVVVFEWLAAKISGDQSVDEGGFVRFFTELNVAFGDIIGLSQE